MIADVIAALAVLLAVAATVCWRSAEKDARQLRGKLRHAQDQARGYRTEAQRLAARNADLRDQLDSATGRAPEPTLSEEWLAYIAELPTTHPEDIR